MTLSLGLCIALLSARPALAQPKPLILQSVQVSTEGGATVVVLEADGPLPAPSTGQVDSPPRFFLDFPGVIAGTRGTRGGAAPVTRVRVALNSSNPPVTRVVLDLAQPQPIRVDTDARESGRIRILVGAAAPPVTDAASAPAAEPKPSSGPPPTPAVAVPLIPIPASTATVAGAETKPSVNEVPLPPVPAIPAAGTAKEPERPAAKPDDLPEPAVYSVKSGMPAPKPSPGDINRYREQIIQPLDRLRALRPILTDIDRQGAKLPEGLAGARSEVSAVIRVLAAVRPPEDLKATHDMLLRAASLSMMAATLRADAGTRADPTAIRNASSAAAGALLLLDRVCIDIGCPERDERK